MLDAKRLWRMQTSASALHSFLDGYRSFLDGYLAVGGSGWCRLHPPEPHRLRLARQQLMRRGHADGAQQQALGNEQKGPTLM
ncbi:hypothetical protein [Cupriavidus consociatus]|uniref:hypothetical protein n=1 Tax=Cupriavidus consociatus TaxID=2821357 RepID=UPI001AE9FD36|nr:MULTISPECIES: hypothetical protein [unclassified Cupriavidus]MBP0624709.1 hypothetical protein [Cupriavidus sp. LEh25]MDK2661422.1 hypothetical protein [Cupriavidus sp. LEh21]